MIDARGSSVKKGKGNSLKAKAKKYGDNTLGRIQPPKPKPRKTTTAKRTGYTGPQKIMMSAKKRNATTRSAIRQAGR